MRQWQRPRVRVVFEEDADWVVLRQRGRNFVDQLYADALSWVAQKNVDQVALVFGVYGAVLGKRRREHVDQNRARVESKR